MICTICKKRIHGANKIKRKGVWWYKHKTVFCKHLKIVDTEVISQDITKHTIERI